MPYSSDNAFGAVEGDDIYQPDHGRYVLMSSPGVGQMKFLGFEKARARAARRPLLPAPPRLAPGGAPPLTRP